MALYRSIIIISLVFLSLFKVNGQSLYIELTSKDLNNQPLIDSLRSKNSFKDYQSLENSVDSVYAKLLRKGYIDAQYAPLKKINDSTYASVFTLGRQVQTIKIFLNGQVPPYLRPKILGSNSGDSLAVPIEHLEGTLKLINNIFIEQGDPFSKLELNNIQKKSADLMTADLVITTNSIRTIDKIVVKGYEKFPKSFIKHYLKIKNGDVFKTEDLNQKTQELSNLIFARQTREPEVLFTQDSTTLYLYLEKNPSNNFDGFLGFGTNEETNKLELDGYLNLQLVNNLNFGEALRISYKSDEIDQQTLNVRLQAPYLFKTRVGAEIGLNIFRKDTTFVTTTQVLQLNYQLSTRQSIGLGINGVNSSNLLDDGPAVIEDYSSFFYSLNYNYIQPQYADPLFPVNFFIDFTIGQGTRNSDIENLSQTKIKLDSYKLFNFNDRNSIYVRAQGAALVSDNFFDNELFRFGGINSIRGIEENSLVADLYGVLNTEYRYRLSSNLFVNSVIDAAYFENQITAVKEKIFGFGFGFGLLTQAGLFRFNYASAKVEDQPFRLSNSKVHISLTARF